jgi:hypothetical protein
MYMYEREKERERERKREKGEEEPIFKPQSCALCVARRNLYDMGSMSWNHI